VTKLVITLNLVITFTVTKLSERINSYTPLKFHN